MSILDLGSCQDIREWYPRFLVIEIATFKLFSGIIVYGPVLVCLYEQWHESFGLSDLTTTNRCLPLVAPVTNKIWLSVEFWVTFTSNTAWSLFWSPRQSHPFWEQLIDPPFCRSIYLHVYIQPTEKTRAVDH